MKIQVKVKPNSKKQSILEAEDGSLIVRLKSPPIDGKANAELVRLLAKKYNVPKSRISITVGRFSKMKRVEIDGEP